MTRHIRLSAAAQKDVTEARDWYAEKPVPGLDLRFLEELEDVFQQIDTFPQGFPVRHKDVRHPRVWMRRR